MTPDEKRLVKRLADALSCELSACETDHPEYAELEGHKDRHALVEEARAAIEARP